MLHTIELILGLAPLASYTQYAAVPYDLFTSTPDCRPYTFRTPTYPMDKKKPARQARHRGLGPAGPQGGRRRRAGARGADLGGNRARGPDATRVDRRAPGPDRGGIRPEALRAWAHGQPCDCSPLRDGLEVAPAEGDGDD